jgi:hypothetical protein
MIRYHRPVRDYIGKMSICDECDAPSSHSHKGVVVQRIVTKGKERNLQFSSHPVWTEPY